MDVGENPRFAKHLMKARAGMPLGAILQSMRVVDGCSDAEIEAFRLHAKGSPDRTALSATSAHAAPAGGTPSVVPPAPPTCPIPPPPLPPGRGRSPPATLPHSIPVWRQRLLPLLQAGPNPSNPVASLCELEAVVRATLRCDISCWDHGGMRALMVCGGNISTAISDVDEPVWSEEAIAHIEAVLLELELSIPVLADAPAGFRKYLVR
jgi:hypothetical protein